MSELDYPIPFLNTYTNTLCPKVKTHFQYFIAKKRQSETISPHSYGFQTF